ncbi:hypothetical protein BJ978_003265 [Agromyces terreus]|uniref:DUF2530 domain-containing protein n=1 Tax=Agromyces terreus TaxID=424795 RepID=A0A9X2H9L2_9MICO|nr:DUF2530 domain-containing protein [Agromyces terreus]MCP2372589.1 hypothetical protein [Agromyces terreus]
MRLWLPESERRPDPAPARADARKAVLAGTALWGLALVACVVARATIGDASLDPLVWTCAIGTAIGVVALAAVQVIRRRASAADPTHRRTTGQTSR